MEELFSYSKKDSSSFERKEEYLDKLLPEFPIKGIEPEDVPQTGYEDSRWVEKSKSIKARDNYTCQLCHTFNPSIGDLVFVKQGRYDTVHRYYWAGDNYYDIYVKGYILTITFHFYAGFHLVMPRLNVHHKIYYRNRNLWDYQDDELVTLCEDCHHYIHSLKDIGIPIVNKDANGQNILVGRTQPKTYLQKLDHTDLGTFKSFSLVEENLWGLGLEGQDALYFKQAKADNKQWYDYHEVLDEHVVHISYFTSYDTRVNNHTPEEIKEAANYIILDFIENILGFKKKK